MGATTRDRSGKKRWANTAALDGERPIDAANCQESSNIRGLCPNPLPPLPGQSGGGRDYPNVFDLKVTPTHRGGQPGSEPAPPPHPSGSRQVLAHGRVSIFKRVAPLVIDTYCEGCIFVTHLSLAASGRRFVLRHLRCRSGLYKWGDLSLSDPTARRALLDKHLRFARPIWTAPTELHGLGMTACEWVPRAYDAQGMPDSTTAVKRRPHLTTGRRASNASCLSGYGVWKQIRTPFPSPALTWRGRRSPTPHR